MTLREAGPGPRIAIVADDLIWASRLAGIVQRAGGEPVRLASATLLQAALTTLDGCVVDLGGRSFDGTACAHAAAAAQLPCVAVGPHTDVDGRRAARDAGAAKVYAYSALFEHGDRDLGGWVAGLRRQEAGS